MKLLYITDTHVRGTAPKHRTDDFAASLQAKLREVVALCHAHGVAALLHGGDLFDRADASPAVALQYVAPLKDAPCPVYTIAGNHDIFGLNPDTLPRTMLGLCDGFGLLKVLRPGDVVWLEQDGLKVQITGQEYHYDIDRRDPVLDYCVQPAGSEGAVHLRHPEADFAIHLTHGMLMEKAFIAGMSHTLLDAVMGRTVADLTFGGHYHPGWSRLYSEGGRLFCNPGALVRLGLTRADMERIPQAVLVEITGPGACTVQFLPLRCALPGAEVLDRSGVEAEQEREKAMAYFLQAVAEAGNFQVPDIEQIVSQIAENTGVPEPVRQDALRRLGVAREALALGEAEEE